MDYEKKYKNALEWARQVMNGETGFIRKEVEEIFPELKSKDERIRKAIIESLPKYGYLPQTSIKVEDAIAWLGKQGEKPQGKTYIFEGKSVLEAINKEKVEPKFHEGEWLCENEPNNYARFIQILEIVNVQGKERYRISRDIHNDEDIVEFDFVEKYYHKFDIEDAKPGDVLVNGSNIFIFHFLNDTRLMGYCHVNTDDGRFYDDIGKNECFCLIDAVVVPATKEQRDTLMKAMADAGYTFDFAKKELKKIHVIDEGKAEMDYCFTKMMNGEKVKPQSPTTACSKELEEKMYEACDRFFAPNTDPNRYSAADLFYAGVEAGCNLNTPAEWSEEDERMLNHIIGYLHSGDDFQTGIDWMKSLKERYTWKPSEYELEVLRLVAEKDGTCLMGLYKQLKKLREG